MRLARDPAARRSTPASHSPSTARICGSTRSVPDHVPSPRCDRIRQSRSRPSRRVGGDFIAGAPGYTGTLATTTATPPTSRSPVRPPWCSQSLQPAGTLHSRRRRRRRRWRRRRPRWRQRLRGARFLPASSPARLHSSAGDQLRADRDLAVHLQLRPDPPERGPPAVRAPDGFRSGSTPTTTRARRSSAVRGPDQPVQSTHSSGQRRLDARHARSSRAAGSTPARPTSGRTRPMANRRPGRARPAPQALRYTSQGNPLGKV